MAQSTFESAREATLQTRRLRVLELRREGHTFQEIADALRGQPDIPEKYSRQVAHEDFRIEMGRLMAETAEVADEVRRLELDRLDGMALALWPRASKGDDDAIDSMLKIMARRSKLLGLDAPAKVAETDPEGKAVKRVDLSKVPTAKLATLEEILQAATVEASERAAPDAG